MITSFNILLLINFQYVQVQIPSFHCPLPIDSTKIEKWSRKCDDKNLSSVGHTTRSVKTTRYGSRILAESEFGFEIRIRNQIQIQVQKILH
jgi:hypothetical protein